MARIIIIDDDPMFARVAQSRLVQDGHNVQWHEGAFGALAAVRNGDYEVILVDVQMPHIEGDKLVSVLRARGVGRACIILMSSVPEHELKDRAKRYGADGYFPKGQPLATLARLVSMGTSPNVSGLRPARGASEYQLVRIKRG